MFRLASVRLPQALQGVGISGEGANGPATCVLSSGLLMLLTQAFLRVLLGMREAHGDT